MAAPRLHVAGRAPWFPNLARVMDEAPGLMDALASEFAPRAAKLSTPAAYWLAFNGWIGDRLAGPIMQGEVGPEVLRQHAWAVYASGYWATLELRTNWGMPPALQRLGIGVTPPRAEMLQGFADRLDQRRRALADGGDHCLHILPSLLREQPNSGPLHDMAYNAGVQVVKTEDPPLGQRPAHLSPKPGAVRINPRDFMRVDYDLPTPPYLRQWRSAFEAAVRTRPEAYEKALVGEAGQKDLREIWRHAVDFGNTTWGGGATDKWTQAYYDETVRWSSTLNLGLEAVALAALVAVINQDEAAAKRAVLGNAIFLGASSAALMGLLDVKATLPTLVKA